MRCPCRKVSEAVDYEACCGRYHGGVAAPTAEALMRSRYAAFALDRKPYILATWHPSTRPSQLNDEPGRDWYMLKIVATEEAGDRAVVEFIARSRMGGRTHALHERSRFVREAGVWFYVDGDIDP
jgi:SEC-C motif-containing protein